MSQALYRKWRPQAWEQVIGQDHVIQTLRNAVAANRMAHAYLLAGPRGTGKTTTARLLAKAANCLDLDLSKRPCNQCENCEAVNSGRFLDLIEIDAASNTSVEDVRSLRDKINFSPNVGRFKVYIIDEVHMLSTAAFNALLKTLEEPPAHAIFILATTEVHKIPATVLSRCQRHEFRRVPVNEIVENLKTIIQGEKIHVEPEALTLVARQATGSMRDAISLLDQLASTGANVTLEMAQSVLGTAASQAILDTVEALLRNDAKEGLEEIYKALDGGSDPRQFTRQMVEYLRGLLLIKMGNSEQIKATPEIFNQMKAHAERVSAPDLLHMVKSFNQAASDTRLAWQPTLPLEMALIEAVEPPENTQTGGEAWVQASRAASTKKETTTKAASSAPASQVDSTPAGEGPAKGGATQASMAAINEQWRKVLAVVAKGSYQTEALLKSGSLLGMKEGVLYFGISAALKDKLEKKEHLELIHQGIAQVFGSEIPFQVVSTTGKQKTPPPGVDSDGLVATALRDLGGEIVDIQ